MTEGAWHLWSELNESGAPVRYDPPLPINYRLPAQVEYTPDGCWATLYDGNKPVRVWMWMGLRKTRRGVT